MTTDELNTIVAAVVAELEKSGVDFDFKIETPLDTDNVFVIRGTAPNYQGVTVTWKGLLDIITSQATQAKTDAETAKNAADTILSQVTTMKNNVTTMESNVSTMKTSIETTKSQVEGMKNAVETTKGQVETMKTSIETTKEEVETMKTSVETSKSQVETMKTSIETTKGEVETLKGQAETAKETATQKAAETTQAKSDVELMKASVEQTVTDFNALADQKKSEVQGVYQNDLNELKGDLIENVATSQSFVLGSIDTNGKEVTSTNIARSGYIYIDSSVRVNIEHVLHPEYRIYVYVFDINKGYLKETSGIAYSFDKQNFRGYIRVCVRNTNISSLTDEDILTLKNALTIDVNNATQSIKTLYDKTIENASEISEKVDYEVYTDKDYNLLCNVYFEANKSIDPRTGLTQSAEGEYASDYIPIDASKGYICKNTNVYDYRYDTSTKSYYQTYRNSFVRYLFAFYDINKEFIPLTESNTTTSIAIPSNARFIRVTVSDYNALKTARLVYGNYSDIQNMRQVESQLKPKDNYLYTQKTGYENFNMVMFGDSITHGDLFIDNDGISYVDYMGDYLGANIYNVGLGGTRAALAPNETLKNRYLLAFFNLCSCIVNNDWIEVDEYLSSNPSEASYIPHIDRLKSIDWESVHAIGIMYGANDYMTSTPIGNEYNTDYHNYDGAIAYGLDLLLTKYPHLQVILFSPFYRQPTNGDIETDTDNATNSAGISMAQYGESLKNVSDVIHCPVIDMYHCIGINKYNKTLLMEDGTHPRTTLACKRMGRLFAEQIKQYIFPLL